MMARINRLSRQKDFDAIFSGGATFQDRSMILKLVPSGLTISRFGIVVSKKVSKKAVARNRLRRQLSEIIRYNQKKIKPGFDVILIPKPGPAEFPFGELETGVNNLFLKAGLLSKE